MLEQSPASSPNTSAEGLTAVTCVSGLALRSLRNHLEVFNEVTGPRLLQTNWSETGRAQASEIFSAFRVQGEPQG